VAAVDTEYRVDAMAEARGLVLVNLKDDSGLYRITTPCIDPVFGPATLQECEAWLDS
jgi:hypothetical protein